MTHDSHRTSLSAADLNKRRRVSYQCDFCGIEYLRLVQSVKMYSSGYCSLKCRDLGRTNWSLKEISLLVNYYLGTPHEIFAIKSLAEKLNKTEDAIVLKAGKLGLTDKKRKQSMNTRKNRSDSLKLRFNDPEKRKEVSERVKESIKRNGHPRGMLGKKHSTETKKRISETSKESWKNPGSYLNSTEHRQKLSDRMSELQTSGKLRNNYSRGKGGKRKDLDDIYFRSAWEANIARYLNFLYENDNILYWEYETETFWFDKIKRGSRSYTPDFKIWDSENSDPYFWEVKGWMDQKSKTKLNRMRIYYPDVKIVIIDNKSYKSIMRKIYGLVPYLE